MNVLRVDQLSIERDDLPLLENLSFELQSGNIAQLAGHNGCGKSSLFKVLTGLMRPSAGAVHWNEHVVNSSALMNAGAFEFKSSCLYLGHQVGIKATLSPLENISWYFQLNGTKSENNAHTPNVEQMRTALSKLGLAAFADTPCYQLSAGQQRRAALARLVLSNAPLWLLDEPFTAIDRDGVSYIEGIIEQHVQEGGIVLLTTHQAISASKVHVVNLEAFKPSLHGERAFG